MKVLITVLVGLGISGCDSSLDCEGDGVWLDSANKLCWQRIPNDEDLHQEEAIDYCSSLELNDQTNWRLPSIDELRSLIRGCEANEPGGSCEIVDGEQTGECPECEVGEGPGVDGCYWEPALGESCIYPPPYWSSTDSWCVDFAFGKFFKCSFYLGDGGAEWITPAGAICVRD